MKVRVLAIGAAALLLLWPRRAFASPAELARIRASLPKEARPYINEIVEASKARGVDWAVTAAIGDRETHWGTSASLTERGPAGTSKDGADLGLMQINKNANAAKLAKIDWTDPRQNIETALDILKSNMRLLGSTTKIVGKLNSGVTYTLAGDGVVAYSADAAKRFLGEVAATTRPDPRPLSGDALIAAAAAAYNTGIGNVLRALAAGKSADFTTTGGNYGKDVLARRDAFRARMGTV